MRVNTNLWTCSEAREYFKSKGFEVSDPFQNQYGGPSLLLSSQVVTHTGKDSRRMNTYQTFFSSILRLNSMRKRLIVLEKSSSRTRHPASRQLCWHKIFASFTETSLMRRPPQETRRPTSVPYWGTKERSVLSSAHNPPAFRPQANLFNCRGAQLFAFERDAKRFATLKSMITKAGCRNVEPMNADFLTIRCDDQKYANVTHM